jgi:general secretion pathway protein E
MTLTQTLTLPLFTQLLSKKGIAPVERFPDDPRLMFTTPPDIEDRTKIRFMLGRQVRFERAEDEDGVSRLIKHWRAKLSPELEGTNDSSGKDIDNEYLKDLASDAPIIRMVNHLMERALDLNASDIHFEPGRRHGRH